MRPTGTTDYIRTLITVAFALALLTTPLLLAAFQGGPFPGLTGGFGERTCQVCHFDGPLNEPTGSLRVIGFPKDYAPGKKYDVTVVLKRPGLRRGGFEIAARFLDKPRAGQDAGTFAPADALTQVISIPDGTKSYIQHTKAGTESTTPGEINWTFVWTAPAQAGGPVIVHAVGNATNADSTPNGDFIYTAEVRSGAGTAPAARVTPATPAHRLPRLLVASHP